MDKGKPQSEVSTYKCATNYNFTALQHHNNILTLQRCNITTLQQHSNENYLFNCW